MNTQKQYNSMLSNEQKSAFANFVEKSLPNVGPVCPTEKRRRTVSPLPTLPSIPEYFLVDSNDIRKLFDLGSDGFLTLEQSIEMLGLDFIHLQSGVVETATTSDTSASQEENVEVVDAVEEITLDVGKMSMDPTFGQGLQEDAGLSGFLSRPIEVYRKLWEVNSATPFLDVINPWSLFLNNTRVAEKLQTFKLLKATMHIKFLVNGSPFHYGRVLVGVRPTKFDNNTLDVDPTALQTTTNMYSDGATAFKSVRPAATLYSSRPHVFVDPQSNQPVTISWPFFCGTNWIDLTNSETYDRMGRLEIWELNQLRQSNGATSDNVTISAIAWMEDVTLTGITHRDVVAMQSGQISKSKAHRSKKKKKKTISNNSTKSNDEYHADGAISAPATVVATAAGYFTEIPYIGRFAKATQMAAGTIGDIAKLFGFSKPANLAAIQLYRPQPFGNIANTTGSDPLIKLTLDPKQELTVDPATVGLPGDDEMAIGYIARKEAFVDFIPWSQSVLANRKIYQCIVHPGLAPVTSFGTPAVQASWQTPLSFVTNPFTYWTGSLKYRFQIVASQFHKGRLVIQYDPSPETSFSSTSLAPPLNERYSKIIDIAEERDFTIEVKWSQMQPYRLIHGLPLPIGWTTIGDVGQGLTADASHTNGRLEVFVLNELTSPVDDADIQINVFISAGDDFELKVPDEILSNFAFSRDTVDVGPPATTQSGEITDGENMPAQEAGCVINGSFTGTDPNRSSVFFGESVVSIRSLMKRYCYHRLLTAPSADINSLVMMRWDIFNFPVGPGKSYGSSVASGLTPATGPNRDYNVCNLTYLRYFMQAYIGYRGGLRWKVNMMENDFHPNTFNVKRRSEPGIEGTIAATVRGAGVSSLEANQAYLSQGMGEIKAGAALTALTVNPVLEYELPFYTPYRYAETNEPKNLSLTTYNSNFIGGYHSLNLTATTAATENWLAIETYCAAGEDFSLFFFIGCPALLQTDAGIIV